jgi:hypothetical protein
MWKNLEETLASSLERALETMAAWLPSLVAVLLALLFSTLLAWILRVILRRMLQGVKLDMRLEQWGFGFVAEFSPGKSPTRLICRVTSWVVVLLGLLLGLAAVNSSVVAPLSVPLLHYLPRVLVALAIVFFGSLVARFLARGVLVGAVSKQVQSARLISQITKWLLLIVTYAMALDHLGVGGDIVKIAFALLFGGIVLAMAIAFGLGAQDLVKHILDTKGKEPPPGDDEPSRHL